MYITLGRPRSLNQFEKLHKTSYLSDKNPIMPPNQHSPDAAANSGSLRVAIIGQSQFAADVFQILKENGHIVVGVFTILDKGSREDPLAKIANAAGVPVFKYKTWRNKGKPIEEILDEYKTVNAELNVLPYCSQYIPMEVITYPKHHSICYHPSILPKHRGASSINWTLISGDAEAGLSIFWADDGLDTGPILLQNKCDVEEDDTVDTLYNRFLYPVGITAVAKAVDLVANGTAPRIKQIERGASYEAMLNKPELQKIDWSKSGQQLHNFIRGMDSVPGASCRLRPTNSQEFQDALLFGSTIWDESQPEGVAIDVEGNAQALVHDEGVLFKGSDGVWVNIKRVKLNGRMKLAADINKISNQIKIEFSADERNAIAGIRNVWASILNMEVEDEADFFACGAGSMDVVRLVEEVKDLMKIELENETVFMNPEFSEFCLAAVAIQRGANEVKEVEYRAVELEANGRKLKFPAQLFINGEFVDATGGKTIPTINPSDETIICEVQCASPIDVDKAVSAAKKAFTSGEWSKISARERGQMLYKLADLMQQHKEELATLESIDSGAVYTLALKTHVGMSIETWRYYAGWCDKIQGSTIPIANARPNKNLTFTKKEPIGVCALITPWNYPLMMLSWKMAACLAAGNTVIIKPAQVCPLTALKFAELSVKAGIPAGVINVLAGTGSVAGQCLADHKDVRKLGFTGSTEIGKVIMGSCAASNLKKVSLELGGKSPLVIFADCDMDKAVRIGMQSVFFNKGENCIAAGRIFVENSIYDEYVAKVVKETRKIKIGNPLDRSTAHGPQNHKAHFEKLLKFVEVGIGEGAKLEIGGRRFGEKGFYFEPTIFSNVEDDMWIAREESFGPIMIISRFKNNDLEGVLKRSNATEYGLASGVFTKDLGKAMRFAERVEAGTVFVNTYNKTDVSAPFGGFKQSGFGKDLGQDALNEYLKTKCVTIEY